MAITRDDIQRRIDLGLRDLWYPVAPSWALGANALGVTRLDENIVLWRNAEGDVHCIEDRCPHRGARLSLGWNLGDKIACWYHGVQVTPDGAIADVPAVENAAIVGRKCLRRYHAVERHGAIWVFFGEEETEPPALDLPPALDDDGVAKFLCVAKWRVGQSYALDNVADPMHGTYLHAASHSMAQGDKSATFELTPTPHGFRFAKTGQTGVNFDWVEFGVTTTPFVFLEIPYGPGAGPGGNFGIVGVATPVDERTCLVFFWRTRKVSGWRRDLWRFMYRTRLEGLHWDVLEQDRIVLENMAPNARRHELLYEHDQGVGALRRLLSQRARQQLAEEAAATGS